MSRYLSIESEWLDQPLAADPLERRTWARLEINIAGCTVTRLWDRHSLAERLSIYVPAFPLAAWIAANWWALLHEPARSVKIPSADGLKVLRQRTWLGRHCFRAADSGVLLPRLCIYSDGHGLIAESVADDQDAYAHMPGQFVASGYFHLPLEEVQNPLREFVSRVVARINGEPDERALELKRNWQAISEADAEETAFCSAAGRLGLDPYQSDAWDLSLVELLERDLGDANNPPIVADLLEAADPQSVVALWGWVESMRKALDLQPAPKVASVYSLGSENPVKSGYRLAAEVRRSMGAHAKGPLGRVADAALAMGINAMVFEHHNHLRSPSVRATVGWRAGRDPVVAGPRPMHEQQTRFVEARALYHAVFTCHKGPRLVTDAQTWDQRASRTFAAELLAPQAELMAQYDAAAWVNDPELFEQELAKKYNVSTMLVRHQLENAGVDLSEA